MIKNIIEKSKGNKRYQLIIVMVLFITFLAIALLILSITGSKKMTKLLFPYEDENGWGQNSSKSTEQTARGFAEDLCVGEDNISISGVSVSEDRESAGLFSVEDKSILYSKGIYNKIYPASVTKIMTAIVALKYGNMNDEVTIDWEMVELEKGSQVCGFKIGDRVKMEELLHGLLIHSGNDAAMAIAKHVGGGSINKFVSMMNEEAHNLGATQTHFENPSGLHSNNHYTSVYDIYLMLTNAIKYQKFVDIIQLDVYNITYLTKDETAADGLGMAETFVRVDSTDRYLIHEVKPPKNVTVIGGKTGTTDVAGNCLALVSQNAYGKPYISIIVNASSKTILYQDMNHLLSTINN